MKISPISFESVFGFGKDQIITLPPGSGGQIPNLAFGTEEIKGQNKRPNSIKEPTESLGKYDPMKTSQTSTNAQSGGGNKLSNLLDIIAPKPQPASAMHHPSTKLVGHSKKPISKGFPSHK